MYMDDNVLTVHFSNSGDRADVPVAALTGAIVDFLTHYGVAPLLGDDFCQVIGDGSGKQKWKRLLAAAGYGDDAGGFCESLVRQLEKASSQSRQPVAINGIEMPHLLRMAVLEQMIPGDRFTSVKSVDRLEKLANIRVPADQREDLQKVLETYPVRLSTHTIRQMRSSSHVAYQFMPFVEELDPVGYVNTWVGQFHDGLLERMYQNRVIFLLNMTCPVYCRFCFRKHKETRNQPNPSVKQIRTAVDYVADNPTIKEIVITGGDPLMNRSNLDCAIEGLMAIDHVQTLRVATRSVSYYPNLFYANDSSLLKYLKSKSYALQMRGKRMELATHFIHPDEISPESLDLIADFVNHGIPVYIQTPFLADCNDQGPELVRLFGLLRGAGAELHYIYIPCSAIQGNSVYWTPITQGIQAAHYLRAHLSDRVTPSICTATPIGKMDWHSSGWAVEPVQDNDNCIWIRTPYTPDYFKNYAPLTRELDNLRVNAEGTIDIQFMAKVGDDALFLGNRRPVPAKELDAEPAALPELQAQMTADQRIIQSMVNTGCPGIYRPHKTRVEIDMDTYGGDLSYLQCHAAITDVVLSAAGDAVDHLYEVTRIIRALRDMPHVNAVRLRSFKFNTDPSCYTRAVINRLGDLNRVTVVHPLRLEIETQFLHPSEFRQEHKDLNGRLRNKGITVYANLPLLADINDRPDIVSQLAYEIRRANMEFHHVYAAGLPIQENWSADRPMNVAHIIDIAGRVRMMGSGREVPRYIIRTALGEVDFGMTSKMTLREGKISVTLSPYDLDYYRQMDPDFTWPEGVAADADGKPVVPVPGLTDTGGFMVTAGS